MPARFRKKADPVRFAFFGCGAAGMNHLAELCRIQEARVAAVCDLRRSAAQAAARRFGIPKAYTDAEKLFAREKVDAAAIVTSTGSHCPLTLLAARHKAHVIVEKPMATRVEEAHKMVRTCRRAGVILAVTYTYRFVPETRAIKRLIDSGRLGRLLEVRFTTYGGEPFKYPRGSDERRRMDGFYSDKGLGMVYDCGTHAFDLLAWYAGAAPKRVEAWGTHHLDYPYPDTATALIEFDNGVKGVYDYGSLAGAYDHFGQGRSVLTIMAVGEGGSAVYNLAAGVAGRSARLSYLDILTKASHRVRTFPVYGKQRDVQYRQFIRSVRAGRPIGNFPTPEEALLATKLSWQVLRRCMRNPVRSPLRSAESGRR
ncbi:MAG: Gfo/Idh/MocA family oxidoreductase [Planctomycetota bacterium]